MSQTHETKNTTPPNNPPAPAPTHAHGHGQPHPPKKKSKVFPIVLVILVVLGGAFGVTKYLHSLKHEETDDAQIETNISPVIPRISGYITEVRAKDNQRVKKGDTLLVLDNRNEQLQVEQAEASLAAATSGLSVAQATKVASAANVATFEANVSTADAQIEAAKVAVTRTTQDYNRYANLIKDHSITQQQFEQAEAAKLTAERQLQVLHDQRKAATRQTAASNLQSAATGQQVSVANANILQKRADVEHAKLNLSYTVITAPEDGIVSKVNAQVGQFLQTGQTLFSIVMDENPWVVANFKETQLAKMRPGQKVTVHVDAYPDHDFQAKVSSFSPATGTRFSLLPPDNASGNFVKVVQRLPVKIEFMGTDMFVKELRPGMNVVVDVHID